jgi:hypothetical protein
MEASIEWNQIQDKWKCHYSLYGPEAKHAFNVFFDLKVFFARENPTSNIPLSLGNGWQVKLCAVLTTIRIKEDFSQEHMK